MSMKSVPVSCVNAIPCCARRCIKTFQRSIQTCNSGKDRNETNSQSYAKFHGQLENE